MTKTKRFTANVVLPLEPTVKETLKQIAANNGTSVNHVIRQAIRQLLTQVEVRQHV